MKYKNRKIEKYKNYGFPGSRFWHCSDVNRSGQSLMPKFTTGFTLVESLVAVSILMLSILATFTAAQNSIHSSILAKDQTTAFYLIQEAMEYIRNIRDENALQSISSVSSGGPIINWLTGLSNQASDPCYFGKTCRVDSPAKVATACSGDFGSCSVLNQDSTSGLFGYTSGSATNFKREIQFQSLGASQIKVTILVSWTAKLVTRSVQVEQLLFDRQ